MAENKFDCRFATPTETIWLPWLNDCLVVRCSLPAARATPAAFVADGHVRKATPGDTLLRPEGGLAEPDEAADYVCVRGCFCNRDSCAYFEEGDKG